MAVSSIDGENRRKPSTCRKSLTNLITYCIEYTSPWAGLELTTLVVICTDCIWSHKSNYHMITTTTTPYHFCIWYKAKWYTTQVKMFSNIWHRGTCKVQNEIETKRNETERNETKSNKAKRNRTKRNETDRNETKRNVTKKNQKFNMVWRLRGFIIYWLSKFRRLKGFPVLYYNDYPNLLYLSIFFLYEILNNW